MEAAAPVLTNAKILFKVLGHCLEPGAPLPRARATEVINPSGDYSHDLAMSVERDPRNPKIIYVDRVRITDAEGYQDVSNRWIADIRRRAEGLGRPDPTQGIPKKPGRDYNY